MSCPCSTSGRALQGLGWREETLHGAGNSAGDAGDPRRLRLARGNGRQRRPPAPSPTSTGCGAAARTPSCTPPAATSACPDGQMGNSEVGHMNIGAGRVVMQELVRITPRCRTAASPRRRRSPDFDRQAEGVRRHLPPARPGVAGRRAFAPGPRRRAGEDPAQRRRPDRAARLHRRPRHPAAIRRPTASRRLRAALPQGVRIATVMRPLLRHGPRQALGPRRPRPTPRSPKPTARISTIRCSVIKAAYAPRSDRRVHPARPSIGDYKGMQDGDGILCFNFRADRVREILGRPARSRVRRLPPQASHQVRRRGSA